MHSRITAAGIAAATALFQFPVHAATDPVGETVVVTATRQQQRIDDVLVSMDVIGREEIERAGHSTLAELLAARPGIQVSTTGGPGARSGMFIRGANSEHTMLLLDGMRVGSATNGAPTLEMIPLDLVERIEILRGPASALYGADALGGVIHVITRRDTTGVRPSLRIGAGTNDTYSASAGVAGGAGPWRYNLHAGHDRSRGFDAMPDSNAGTDRDRDGFRNDYGRASVAYSFRQQDEIGLSLFRSDGRNWYDGGYDYDSYIDKRIESADVHMRNKLHERWISTVRFGLSKDISHTRTTAAAPASEFDTRQTQFSWQNDVELAGGSLLAAYEVLNQRIDTTGTFDKSKRRVNSWLLGWGGQFDRHSVQFNARHDRNSQFGNKTTGIAAYGYQIDQAWRVHGSIGTAFRAPTFNDLYFPLECFPPWGCFGGNADLKPEEAFNREIGVVWERAGVKARATYFNNRVKNLIVWGNVPENVGTATLEGVELGLETMLMGFNLRVGYDYLDARDKDTGDRLRRRAKHSASLAADRVTGDWRYGIEWNGQGRRFDGMPNTPANRLGGYGVTNLYVHYNMAPDWMLELRANNVFDKKYQLSQGFATAGANAFVAVRYAPR